MLLFAALSKEFHPPLVRRSSPVVSTLLLALVVLLAPSSSGAAAPLSLPQPQATTHATTQAASTVIHGRVLLACAAPAPAAELTLYALDRNNDTFETQIADASGARRAGV